VQAWVLAAVPTLLAGGVTLLLALPRLVPAAVQAAGGYLERLGAAARGGDVVATGAGVVELLVLALPWVGLLLLLGSVGRLLARLLLRGWTPGTRARARRVLRGAVVGTALGALGAAVVARIGWAALTLPPTDGQTRAGTWPARWQLAGWDRLTAASTRHPTPVAGAREVAVLACAVLVATALALVAAGRVRVLAVALPLAAVGALGPVVTALATGGPGLLGAAEVAVGTVVLCSVRRGSGVLAGLLAVGAGVATAPVLGVPLVLGAALLADRRRRGPAGRHRAERARGGRHRRPMGGSPGPRRWGSSPVAFPAAALAGASVVHRAPHLRTSSAGWAGGHPR
jgi:putative peptide zinc metalloprotease protein